MPAKSLGLTAITVAIALHGGSAADARVCRVPLESSTIQQAINGSASGDTILISPGRYGGAMNRNIDPGGRSLTFRGLGYPVIDAEHAGRCFNIHSGETTTMEGLICVNGMVNWGGGLYFHGGTATIRNCVFANHSAAYGGAILADDCDLIVGSSVFDHNYGGLRGSALFITTSMGSMLGAVVLSDNGPAPGIECEYDASAMVVCSDLWNTPVGDCAVMDGMVSVAPDYCSPSLLDFRMPSSSLVRRQSCGAVGLSAICSTSDVPAPTSSWSAVKLVWR